MAKIGNSRDLSEGDVVCTKIERVDQSDDPVGMDGSISITSGNVRIGEKMYVRITDQEGDSLVGKVTAPQSENPYESNNNASSSHKYSGQDRDKDSSTDQGILPSTYRSNKNKLLNSDL